MSTTSTRRLLLQTFAHPPIPIIPRSSFQLPRSTPRFPTLHHLNHPRLSPKFTSTKPFTTMSQPQQPQLPPIHLHQPHRTNPTTPTSGPGTDWISPLLATHLEAAKTFRPPAATFTHPPRVLLLYGTLRPQGFSKLLAYECARLLEGLGADVRIYDPTGLPVRDPDIQHHPKVAELRQLVHWSEAHVWTAAELHGNLCSVFKNQIDWIPLNTGSVRPTQGKAVAVLQVNGGSQSFNVVNTLRLLARWMRMPCVTNQSSVQMAWKQFDEHGRMKESSMRDRVVDVMEEFIKFARINREYAHFLTDRFSERKERAEKGRLLTQAEKEKEKEDANIKAKANE